MLHSIVDPLEQPFTDMGTRDLEALLRIRIAQARTWGDLAANPHRYESPSVPEAPARLRHYRRLVVDITSELDRRRGHAERSVAA